MDRRPLGRGNGGESFHILFGVLRLKLTWRSEASYRYGPWIFEAEICLLYAGILAAIWKLMQG